jgi:hypothetical protein
MEVQHTQQGKNNTIFYDAIFILTGFIEKHKNGIRVACFGMEISDFRRLHNQNPKCRLEVLTLSKCLIGLTTSVILYPIAPVVGSVCFTHAVYLGIVEFCAFQEFQSQK